MEEGGKQNQLDLARQLSMRSLWCEQPEIIQSGLLDKLSSEERNLQEVSLMSRMSHDLIGLSCDLIELLYCGLFELLLLAGPSIT